MGASKASDDAARTRSTEMAPKSGKAAAAAVAAAGGSPLPPTKVTDVLATAPLDSGAKMTPWPQPAGFALLSRSDAPVSSHPSTQHAL